MNLTENSNIYTMYFHIGKYQLKNILVTSLSISLKVCSYQKLLLSDKRDNTNGMLNQRRLRYYAGGG
jgi:hypothetical protein